MLANEGFNTRPIQDFLGHRDIRNTVRYTKLSPPSAGERSGVVTISGPRRTGS